MLELDNLVRAEWDHVHQFFFRELNILRDLDLFQVSAVSVRSFDAVYVGVGKLLPSFLFVANVPDRDDYEIYWQLLVQEISAQVLNCLFHGAFGLAGRAGGYLVSASEQTESVQSLHWRQRFLLMIISKCITNSEGLY